MKAEFHSRRQFLKAAGIASGAILLPHIELVGETGTAKSAAQTSQSKSSDYTLRIRTSPVEIAPNRIISMTTYNGQFPGPLIRLKEGQPVTIDLFNETDVSEQLHWHGQMVPVDVDGASEEGTPFVPAHGQRRITFTPRPAGFRFYHTHNRGGANLSAGLYSGEVGTVYIEGQNEPGNHDREIFLVLKEFDNHIL